MVFTRVVNFRENQREKIAILAEHHSISGVIRALLDVYTNEKSQCDGCLWFHQMNVIRAKIRGQSEPSIRLFTISKLTKLENDHCFYCKEDIQDESSEKMDINADPKARDGSD
jgi:hypothetical protein